MADFKPTNRAPTPSADETAIRNSVKTYVEAFNKHDAKALADLWSPDAVYLNQVTGEEVVGRDAIAKQFTAMFKDEPGRQADGAKRNRSVHFAQRGRGTRQFHDHGRQGKAGGYSLLGRVCETRRQMAARPRDRRGEGSQAIRTTNNSNRLNGWSAIGSTKTRMSISKPIAIGQKTARFSPARSRFPSKAKSIYPACRSSVGMRPRKRFARGRSIPTAATPKRHGRSRRIAGTSTTRAYWPTAARRR